MGEAHLRSGLLRRPTGVPKSPQAFRGGQGLFERSEFRSAGGAYGNPGTAELKRGGRPLGDMCDI